MVLTGVDLTSWGADLPGAPQLGNLVQRILKLVPELRQLRISSIDAIEMDEALIAALGEARVAPYLHLSLQHGDDLILKRMKRRHGRDQAIQLTQRLRAVRPDIALGADIIAGFPTETEAHFESSVRLVEECGLSFLHVFPYSPRPGTPAAKMPQVAKPLIKERAARLRAFGEAALARHFERHVGETRSALLERGLAARLPDFTPVRLTALAGEGGQVLPVRITGHDGKQLLGTHLP